MAENLLRRRNSSATLLLLVAVLLVAPRVSGQQTTAQNATVAPVINARPLAFDVVSIKRNTSGSFTRTVSNTPEGIRAVNMRLDLFVNRDLHYQQVFGAPDWLQTDGYDFEVKVADSDVAAYKKAPAAETGRMLHDVLVERLKLKDHRETREIPTYSLVTAKSGPKLKEPRPGNTYADGAKWAGASPTGPGVFVLPGLAAGQRRIVGQAGSIAALVERLSYMAGINRMVFDKTGLSGTYDFEMEWIPEGTSPDPDTATSIFTAIQEQLGLKLEPDRGPVPVLVIDHIERPSAN